MSVRTASREPDRKARGGVRPGAGRKAVGGSAERRARVLDVATRLFAQAGFAATSSARIAREVGISEGTLFHYYPSKHALLSAISDRGAEAILGAGFAGVDPDRDPPDIEAIVRRLLGFARDHEDLYRVFRMGRGSEPRDAGFALMQGEERIIAATAEALARWSARGLMRPMHPRIGAALVFAQLDAVVSLCVLQGYGDEEEACIAELVRSLEGALFERAREA